MSKRGPTAVFVDLSTLPPDGSSGGAALFVLKLLRELSRDEGLRFAALVKPESARLVAPLSGPRFSVEILGTDVSEPRRPRRRLRRLPVGLARLVPDAASLVRRGAEVLFSPLFTALFHEPGLPHVAVAYDFQELHHPEFFDSTELSRRAAFRADLRRADRVAAISSATRDDAVVKAGLDPAKVSVIPPLAGPPPQPLSESALVARLAVNGLASGSYAAYPANFWPHKNHERLLDAVARVVRSCPDFRLVLSGALDAARERLATRIRASGLGDVVRVLPYLDETDIAALIQGARFLSYPSLFEGFGLPVLEAMSLGTPVACSELAALREVAGDDAVYFDPAETASIAGALELLWTSDETRRRLSADGLSRAECWAGIDVPAAYRKLFVF